MPYRIGSFNILRPLTKGKTAERVAAIIKDNRLDVVALQEVSSQDGLGKLLNILGRSVWSYSHASDYATASTDHRIRASKEYAFVWRRDKVLLVREPHICNEIEKRVDYAWQNHLNLQLQRVSNMHDPEELDEEDDRQTPGSVSLSFSERKKRVVEALKADLCRPPMVACFRPAGFWGGLRWELRMINVHIRCVGRIGLREKEYRLIAGKIHTALNTRRFGNFRSVYTIVAGDYNLSLSQIENAVKCPEFERDCEKHNMIAVQNALTTLKQYDESQTPPLQGEEIYNKNVDHFTYDKKRVEQILSDAVRVDCSPSFKIHRTEISDHVPIYVEMNL